MHTFLKNNLVYFSGINKEYIDIFEQMTEIYKIWNSKVNLISRNDIDNLYERHLLHSLSIYKAIKFEQGGRVVDVGTGGGFPGIPLAILFPDVKFFLVDSIRKKALATKEIASELGLKNIIIYNTRFENIDESFDYIIGRAVTNLNNFITLTKHNLSRNLKNSGIYYLTGRTEIEESHLRDFQISEIPCSNYFSESFFREKYLYVINPSE